MSYILDALKKSQQERERGQVPRFDQFWFEEPTAPARHGLWGMLAALLAAAALAVALYVALRPAPISEERVAESMPSPPLATVAEAPAAAPPARTPQIFIAPALPEDGSPLPRGAAELRAALTQSPPLEIAPELNTTPDAASSRIPADLRAEVAALRQQLRQQPGSPNTLVSLSVHVYDVDPAQRFVYINGRKFQEQQPISENVMLRRIAPDGIWLDVGGEEVFQPR